jgi:hypothetical protein
MATLSSPVAAVDGVSLPLMLNSLPSRLNAALPIASSNYAINLIYIHNQNITIAYIYDKLLRQHDDAAWLCGPRRGHIGSTGWASDFICVRPDPKQATRRFLAERSNR